ncbi:hypothetical protein BBJ28_00026007, partial [Nothophytophthora sp. Chile5]
MAVRPKAGAPGKLAKPVVAVSSTSRRRLWVWAGLVTAGALVYLVNVVSIGEGLAAFQLTLASNSSNQANASENAQVQMFPLATELPPMHSGAAEHQVAVEEEDEGEDVEMIRVPPPMRWPPEKASADECLYVRDYGLLERLDNSSRSFCKESGANDSGSRNSSAYTFYHVPQAGLSATRLANYVVDIRGAQVAQDINDLAQDGGGHDPRFKYIPDSASCDCDEPQDAAHGSPPIWRDFFVGGPGGGAAICKPALSEGAEELKLTRAVVLVRKDDHNPFFQISAILNAWAMLKVVGWEANSTQLVTLDRALPSPVDELRHAMLGPSRPAIGGEEFQNHVVRLESALLAPYEATGPLMSHLNDNQPCYANAMIEDFRDAALKRLAITPRHGKRDPRRCLVTVISRRPYGGRRVQRVWQNEAEVLRLMREEYKDAYRFGECEFQALEFVDMSIRDQMRVMLDSDVVIGMHGAGMVNVMWTRPGTLVVEIFPRRRWRWGYRNLCQYLGCKWFDFRKGRDVRVHTSDPNDMDKHIPYAQWKSFFDPLFRDVVDRLEAQVEA